MKIFKRILGNKEENMLQGQPTIEQNDEQLKDFDNSMYKEFEKMKLKVSKLETYMPERVTELKAIVNDLEKSIQEIEEIKTRIKIEEQEKRQEELMKTIKGENVVASLEFYSSNRIIEKEVKLELYFQSKKEVFNMKYDIINQEYLMKCVENFYKRINKVIYLEEAERYEEYGEQNLLEDFKEYYNQLENQQDKFTGLQRNIFISKLKEANYKLKILEILQSDNSIDIAKEWLENRTESDKIIENRLLLSDIRRIKVECNELRRIAKEKGIELKDETLERIEYIEEKINAETLEGIENIGEDNIIQIISILKTIREHKLDLDKSIYDTNENKDNEDKKIEQLYKYRKKENKMREKLIEIDNEDYDNAKSYKKIWKYEKDILKEEGFIDKKVLFENKNMEIIPIERKRIPIILDDAERQGISNYSICLDRNGAYLIRLAKDSIGYSTFKSSLDRSIISMGKGRYSAGAACFLHKKFNIEVYHFSKNSTGDHYKINRSDEKKLIELLQEYKTNTNINSIKFSLEVPYTRPILTILNELKNNNIEYNIIPPMDEHKDQTIRIYINRKNLERYKTQVHSKISNPEMGIIRICDDEVDILEFLLEDCKNVEKLYTDQKISDDEKKK